MLTFLLFHVFPSSPMNVPDWLNTNQLCGLLSFCCIVLSGMHLELDKVRVIIS